VTKLHDLYGNFGQSPWLDNLRRDYLQDGHLAELVEQGIRGVTSNPTIFAKAIEGGSEYDEQFGDLLRTQTVEQAYWDMVVDDIHHALEVLRPVYDSSGGTDGFVSLEVAPSLAHDTAATTESARQLHQLVDRPNLYVKIPGTAEGLAAIRTMVGEGRNVNVTLLFSLERYGEVIDAYLSGLEDHLASGATDLSHVHGVASFFVSRVDTEVDRRLDTVAEGNPGGADRWHALRGTAAVAQAQTAYQLFLDRFTGDRWDALRAKGANLQRPLWASTSTKNPAYPDLKYVEALVGPDTVDTMPDETVDALIDHGRLQRSVDADPEASQEALDRLEEAGIDMADVARTLEDEGVASFAKSFDELMQMLEDKAAALAAKRS